MQSEIFEVKVFYGPATSSNKQAQREIFDNLAAAEEYRFLTVLNIAAEQELLYDVVDELDTDEETIESLLSLSADELCDALAKIDPGFYDEIVDTVTNCLCDGGLVTFFASIEQVVLENEIANGQRKLDGLRNLFNRPVKTQISNDKDRVDHLIDVISNAKRQLHANPNLSQEVLFEKIAQAFATLEEGVKQIS